MKTISKLMDEFGPPSFVKVGIESSEDLAFNNVTSISKETKYNIEVRKETYSHIFSLFVVNGFLLFLLEQDNQEVRKVEDVPNFANLLVKYSV